MAFLQRIARADEKGTDGAVHPRVAAAASAGIIRRVSSIFLPRKKPAPPNLALVSAALACAPRRTSYASASTDSEDDIRIPSGLGSAASDLGSLPPSPFFHAFPTPPGFQRPRSASSPNFETTFNVKMREAPLAVRRPPLPPAVFALVAPHLPRADLAACARLARAYTEPARGALYAHIDLDALSPAHAEKLLALFASRADLPALVHIFTCRAWPPFFSPADEHSAHLTAALASALARMGALCALTLPAFDAALLARHSAFGLRALTLTARRMALADVRALFAWLDGQTNVVALRLPFLADTAPVPAAARSSPHLPVQAASPRVPVFAPRAPPSALAVQLAAPTLLPNLTTLHAPPGLALLLASPLTLAPTPPLASALPFPTRRPLTSLTITLVTTLYAGLRPAALMGALRDGPTHLSLRVARAVDRRTVEKVVGAVGAALGGGDALQDGDDAVHGDGPAGNGAPKREESAGGKDDAGGSGQAKKRWAGTGRVPFAMPMRASAVDLTLPVAFPVQDAPRVRAASLVPRAPEEPRAASLRSMVARAPIVRDDEPPVVPTTDRTLVVESLRARTISTATKRSMVARAPVVRDEDEDEDDEEVPNPALVVESVRVRTISTATKRSMVARAPVVRDEDDEDGKGTRAHLPTRTRTTSAALAKSLPPLPMVARAPVVRAEEDNAPADARRPESTASGGAITRSIMTGAPRPVSTASDASSQRRKLLLAPRAPFARDDGDSEHLASPLAAQSFRSRTESTNSRMVARAPTVRDEPDDATDGGVIAADARPVSMASDASSRRNPSTHRGPGALLLASRAPDAEAAYLASPLAALSFRSRTESTSGASTSAPLKARRMVARAATVRDEDDDADADADEAERAAPLGRVTPAPEPQDRTTRAPSPPPARAHAGRDPRARTVSAGGALRRHGRALSGTLKALVGRGPRAAAADAPPAALPAPDNAVGQQWSGLVSLEVAFDAPGADDAAREEAVYRSLSASLARYRVLTSLTLRILPEAEEESSAAADVPPPTEPTANEQDLLDAWARLCPTLQSVALFSGARWTRGQAPPKKPVHVMLQLTAPGQPFLL
ncbi:hypothetical protein HYPSUDRAFT_219352 [Hypholoma sublateritium FD-334 SS-4]|uniref:Uncharacterized protein n=1 Tax=Hypholoma sublateritium (strain FD-334 SS-4) TaxID=945553 RepID=A0A0D2KPM4_HYPSF|nr:hypothetical protein HYPSUDRAFT_219352 [Hypholoma sublateritium FD-334 SS-4]